MAITVNGVLNGSRASLVFTDEGKAVYNVTYKDLGEEGISITAPEASTYLKGFSSGVTGLVFVGEATITITLLKTLTLCKQYQAAYRLDTVLGSGTVYVESSTMENYDLDNVSIKSVDNIMLNGTQPAVQFTLVGGLKMNQQYLGA